MTDLDIKHIFERLDRLDDKMLKIMEMFVESVEKSKTDVITYFLANQKIERTCSNCKWYSHYTGKKSSGHDCKCLSISLVKPNIMSCKMWKDKTNES